MMYCIPALVRRVEDGRLKSIYVGEVSD